MARLLATQLTMAGMGKGVAEVQRQASEADKSSKRDGSETPAFQGTSPKQLIQTVVGKYELHLSHFVIKQSKVRKPDFCICENKGARSAAR